MNNKKQLIICIIIIICLTIISIITISIVKSNKENNNNIEVIKSSYRLLSINVDEYNAIRSKYTNILSSLFLDDYMKYFEEFNTLLSDYNKTITGIDSAIVNISLKCNKLYKDNEVNKICNNYKTLYEKLINLYVDDLTNYNNIVNKYNEYKNADVALYEMIHKEYIDYNNDGIYEGREENEEN